MERFTEDYRILREQIRDRFSGYLQRFDHIIIPELTDNSRGDWETMFVDLEGDGVACSGKSSKGGVDLDLIGQHPKVLVLQKETGKTLTNINNDFGDSRAVASILFGDQFAGKSQNEQRVLTALTQTVGGDLARQYAPRPVVMRSEGAAVITFIDPEGQIVGPAPRRNPLELRHSAYKAFDYAQGWTRERRHFFQDTLLAREDDRHDFFANRERLLCFMDAYIERTGIKPDQLDADGDFQGLVMGYMFVLKIEDDRLPSAIYSSLKRDLSWKLKNYQDQALGTSMVHWAQNYQTDPKVKQTVQDPNFMLAAVARDKYQGPPIEEFYASSQLLRLTTDNPIDDVYQAMKKYYQWRNNGTLLDLYPDQQWSDPDYFNLRVNFLRDHVKVWKVRKMGGPFIIRRKALEEANLWEKLEDWSKDNTDLAYELDPSNLRIAVLHQREIFMDRLVTL